jgi:hypothetical protein
LLIEGNYLIKEFVEEETEEEEEESSSKEFLV